MKKALLAFLLLSPDAWGNDSEAGVAGGQLILKESTEIAMLSEDLVLSQDLVTVDYEFRNGSKQDIETIVAFPLPEICVAIDQDNEVQEPLALDPDAKDPLQFKLTVDGKAKPVELERKIRKEKNGDRCYGLKYHWKQSFPAGKTLRVSHRYKPANDGFFLPVGKDVTRLAATDKEFKAYLAALRKEACVDDSLFRQLEAKKGENQLASSRLLRYVLKTGANWQGPIKAFKLTVKKTQPTQLVSLCWTGLKKTSPTSFEAKKTDFDPKEDLAVLFLDLAP